jgi:hypothetical protein
MHVAYALGSKIQTVSLRAHSKGSGQPSTAADTGAATAGGGTAHGKYVEPATPGLQCVVSNKAFDLLWRALTQFLALLAILLREISNNLFFSEVPCGGMITHPLFFCLFFQKASTCAEQATANAPYALLHRPHTAAVAPDAAHLYFSRAAAAPCDGLRLQREQRTGVHSAQVALSLHQGCRGGGKAGGFAHGSHQNAPLSTLVSRADVLPARAGSPFCRLLARQRRPSGGANA